MFSQSAAKRIAEWLVQGGAIAAEEREVHEYGLEKLLSTAANVAIVICLGILFGIAAEAAVFYFAYFALRGYVGGYHADTPMRCFFISIGVVIPCLVAIRFQQMWNMPVVFYSLLGVGVFVLTLLGPTGSKNKMPDALEKVVYRRRLLRNLAIVTAGAITINLSSLYGYASAVLCGILLSMVMGIAGRIKLRMQNIKH